jgi:hypothetical protein
MNKLVGVGLLFLSPISGCHSNSGTNSTNVTEFGSQQPVVNDDTQHRFASDPTFIDGRNWAENESGYRLLFETPSATTKDSAADIVEMWPKYLEAKGVSAYLIRWQSPNRIRLCVQGSSDPEGLKVDLMENTHTALDLHVVEQMVFTGGDCT